MNSLSLSSATNLSQQILIIILISFLILLPIIIFTTICLGKVFKKAGRKAWMAWVPFVSQWQLFEVGGISGAWSLLSLGSVVKEMFSLPPIVTALSAAAFSILTLIVMYRISIRFGKNETFFLLAIFCTPVWYGILAFGKSQYRGLLTDSQFAASSTATINPVQPTNVAPTQPQPLTYQPQPQTQVQPVQPAMPQQPVQPQTPAQPEQSQTPYFPQQ